MIRYKIDILSALKEAGYNTYRLQKDKLLSSTIVQKLRSGDATLTIESLNTICDLLRCQPGDLLEWFPAEDEEQ